MSEIIGFVTTTGANPPTHTYSEIRLVTAWASGEAGPATTGEPIRIFVRCMTEKEHEFHFDVDDNDERLNRGDYKAKIEGGECHDLPRGFLAEVALAS